MKYLLILLVIGVVLIVVLGRGRLTRGGQPPQGRAPGAPRAMVVCAHCGVHLPRDEAVGAEPLLYCSQAHQLAGPSGPAGRG